MGIQGDIWNSVHDLELIGWQWESWIVGETRMIPRFLALMTEGMVMPYTELETTHWGRNRFWWKTYCLSWRYMDFEVPVRHLSSYPRSCPQTSPCPGLALRQPTSCPTLVRWLKDGYSWQTDLGYPSRSHLDGRRLESAWGTGILGPMQIL